MASRKAFIFFLSLTWIFSLTSCGFHFRQPMSLAKPLQNLYVQSHDPYGELTRKIKQDLRMSGVHLTASPQEASTLLIITQEAASQELLSINSSQQTRQYSLKLSISFELADKSGRTLVGQQTVTESRP